MSDTVEKVRAALGVLLAEEGFTLTQASEDPEVFGNAVVTFCSAQWCLRVVRDRGQFFVWFKSQLDESKWRDFRYLLAVSDAIEDLDHRYRNLFVAEPPATYLVNHPELKTLASARMRDVGPWSHPEQVRDFLLAKIPKLRRLGLLETWSGSFDFYLEKVLGKMEEQESEATAARIFDTPQEAPTPAGASS